MDHMLGYLYQAQGNVSPTGQPFEGLEGGESNPDASGTPVSVFPIEASTPNAYLMPGADPPPWGAAPLDHTSILKTIENRFGLTALSARDAAASDVSAALTRATPRSYDPLAEVTVPSATQTPPDEDKPSRLQEAPEDR